MWCEGNNVWFICVNIYISNMHSTICHFWSETNKVLVQIVAPHLWTLHIPNLERPQLLEHPMDTNVTSPKFHTRLQQKMGVCQVYVCDCVAHALSHWSCCCVCRRISTHTLLCVYACMLVCKLGCAFVQVHACICAYANRMHAWMHAQFFAYMGIGVFGPTHWMCICVWQAL